jgi:hypothetical protein
LLLVIGLCLLPLFLRTTIQDTEDEDEALPTATSQQTSGGEVKLRRRSRSSRTASNEKPVGPVKRNLVS